MALFADIDRRQVIDATRASLRWTSATLKVLFVSVGSIAAVVFASLIISIIQFQLRLSEARTQNERISLESIQLIADYQDYIYKHYKSVREKAEDLDRLRNDWTNKLNNRAQLITRLCNAVNPEKVGVCYQSLTDVISTSNSQVDTVIANFRTGQPDENQKQTVALLAESLKKGITGGALQKAERAFNTTDQAIRSQCGILNRYVSGIFFDTTLLGVSQELHGVVLVQCFGGDLASTGGATTQTPTVDDRKAPETATPDASSPPGAPSPKDNDVSGVNRTLLSELVFYYKFYSWLTSSLGANVSQLILSPPEFIVILLVIATGTLGSFLFHSYVMFAAKNRDEFPSFFSIMLRATLAVMCALVIYILSRTGFVAIAAGGQRGSDAVISPFVIAFISVAAGLLAERALERIRAIGLTALKSRSQDEPAERPKSEARTTDG